MRRFLPPSIPPTHAESVELASEVQRGLFVNPEAIRHRWAVSIEYATQAWHRYAPRFKEARSLLDKARMLPV
jgi:hypothetical protein